MMDAASTEIYSLTLHDALPIYTMRLRRLTRAPNEWLRSSGLPGLTFAPRFTRETLLGPRRVLPWRRSRNSAGLNANEVPRGTPHCSRIDVENGRGTVE